MNIIKHVRIDIEKVDTIDKYLEEHLSELTIIDCSKLMGK